MIPSLNDTSTTLTKLLVRYFVDGWPPARSLSAKAISDFPASDDLTAAAALRRSGNELLQAFEERPAAKDFALHYAMAQQIAVGLALVADRLTTGRSDCRIDLIRRALTGLDDYIGTERKEALGWAIAVTALGMARGW